MDSFTMLLRTACIAALLALPVQAATQESASVPEISEAAIAGYCTSPSLTPAEKHTIDVMLETTGHADCPALFRAYATSRRNSPSLFNKGISNLTLFSYLPRLHYLSLSKNQVSDLGPLRHATDLEYL